MMPKEGHDSKTGRCSLTIYFCLSCFGLFSFGANGAVIEANESSISSSKELSIAKKNADLLKKEAVQAQKESRFFLLKALPLAADIQKLQRQIDREKVNLANIEHERQEQQLELARQRKPLTKLAAALERMARYPLAMTFIQPNSTGDIIHLREIIAAARPIIQQRSASALNKIAAINNLYRDREEIINRIKKDQNVLEEKRQYFLSLAHNGQEQAENWLSQAMYQEDAAIAAEQELRDKGRMRRRSLSQKIICPFPLSDWHIPVEGWVSQNSDEEAIYIIAPQNAEISSPQSGVVLYAGDFRSYKQVVIIRHKGGYTSLLTGLDKAAVKTNQPIKEKQLVGYAAGYLSEIGFQVRHNDETVALWPDIKEALQQNGRSACNFLADLAQENNTEKKTP